jgi:hypothetical protein
MKIDKIVFSVSASAEYAPFWNIQSRIWKTKLGIEPVCLLFGNHSEVFMSEEHGIVVKMETLGSEPWSVQLVWSKFDYPTHYPDTTFIIGDIDLIPLQKPHFIDNIASVDDNAYVHLNAGGIAAPRLGCQDGFLRYGSQRHALDAGIKGGADLPGHYHVAKGSNFNVLTQGLPFSRQIKHIVDSNRYGLGPMGDPSISRETNPYWYYWCAEEGYSSELLCNAVRGGRIQFVPFYYNNSNGAGRVDRDCFTSDYQYDRSRVAGGGYVDIHCARPYARQAAQLEEVIKAAWGI